MAVNEARNYSAVVPQEVRDLEETYLFPTYNRTDLYVARGDGAYVFDMDGRSYLDFLSGIAVNSLGYNHPRIAKVLTEQGQLLCHCSNLFYHSYQGQLARRLVNISGMSRVFFTNSGAEAMETALKISRAYPRTKGKEDKTKILALRDSFHGRTLGALSVTAQAKYQAPFRPLVPDVEAIEELSIPALERSFSDRVCCVIVEPIQGEAGVIPLPRSFLQAARDLCDKFDALLVMDEIQCGMGRTGRYFAFQHYGVQPDIVTLAKSLASGYPMGATLGNARVADSLKPGEHGTTFGGGPLACRLALEVLDVIEDDGLLDRVSKLGEALVSGLRSLASSHSCIGEVRGLGLMVGAEVGSTAKVIVSRLLDRGIIANAAHETVLRLLPPFIISQIEIDHFLDILDKVLSEMEAEGKSQADLEGD